MTTERNLGIVSPVAKDDWNNKEQYLILNIVRHNGACYIAKKNNINIEPNVSNNWEEYWMQIVPVVKTLYSHCYYLNITRNSTVHSAKLVLLSTNKTPLNSFSKLASALNKSGDTIKGYVQDLLVSIDSATIYLDNTVISLSGTTKEGSTLSFSLYEGDISFITYFIKEV